MSRREPREGQSSSQLNGPAWCTILTSIDCLASADHGTRISRLRAVNRSTRGYSSALNSTPLNESPEPSSSDDDMYELKWERKKARSIASIRWPCVPTREYYPPVFYDQMSESYRESQEAMGTFNFQSVSYVNMLHALWVGAWPSSRPKSIPLCV